MSWTMTERWWLARTAEELGPHAPTLCEGWDSHHLLAHLVTRERRPWEFALDQLAGRPPGQEPHLSRTVATTPYDELIAQLRAGPPLASPVKLMGDRGNLLEFLVHHEDLRRGGPDPLPPRERAAAFRDAVWSQLVPVARLRYARSPVGVVLVVPDGPRATVRRRRESVAVVGDVVELVLHAFGRTDAAHVELLGSDTARAAFTGG